MISSFALILAVTILILILTLSIAISLISGRLGSGRGQKATTAQRRLLRNALSGALPGCKEQVDLIYYNELKEAIQLEESKRDGIEQLLKIKAREGKYIRQLSSIYRVKRKAAAVQLGFLATENARKALELALAKEKLLPVKLFIVNALVDIGREESIPVLVNSLRKAHRWYRYRVNVLIAEFGEMFHNYLPQLLQSEETEIRELIVDFANGYYSETLRHYLLNLVDNEQVQENRENNNGLTYRAARVLASFYPQSLDQSRYLEAADPELKIIAIQALAKINSPDNLVKLISFLADDTTARAASSGISQILESNPRYLGELIVRFTKTKDLGLKQRLAEILSTKVEYFIMKLTGPNSTSVAMIIREILLLGRTSEIIDFLNKNKDIDLENELLSICKEAMMYAPVLEKDFRCFLRERILQKCDLTPLRIAKEETAEPKDRKLIITLYFILIAALFAAPAVYLLRHYNLLKIIPLGEQLKIYVTDFNYYLAYYAIAINAIYLILLGLSYFKARKQAALWNLKKNSLLFKGKILPTISIIAPAFNEEKNIIESTNSLLNLKYPDYELIIVNDGSTDQMLDTLIRYYDLIRVDYLFECKLNTKPVRGIYLNRSMPKLIVVDKENGGKADSLNTGINIANKEYFCGIDADSLLEDEALLRLASLTLNEGVETPALGGNIFPINGCTVNLGQLQKIRLPLNSLARFQTLEYIRAFMAGRLGWASLNSLLIISGAFGLFRKERVISVGGYLTSSGKYGKSTVGEDMELVVRIRRLMQELGLKYKIGYAFNANCWTEVPEDLRSLKKQRYRWHRGLIDTLLYHKKMLFNPTYGRTGFLAMPYFFVFEMIGPLFESQGYLMVLAAIGLGILNIELVLLLFVSNIMLGILVSTSSLLISEKAGKYFPLRDLLVLLSYAIIENFGPRQFFSLWRVGGYVSMLHQPSGWGKLERKGFTATNPVAKG